jgi:hypothetical protein
LESLAIRRTPLLTTLLRPELGFPRELSLAVHPADEMLLDAVSRCEGDWDRAVATYLYAGLRVSETTRQLVDWRFGEGRDVDVLDFASGYGRVTRFLLGRLGAERLAVSDLMPEAVRFQRQSFGVAAFDSTVVPERLSVPGDFDVVQAVSLFSHLPRDLFRRWLVTLWSLVRPGGLLVVSVHDRSLVASATADDDFVFVPSSENAVLDSATYGSTWVSEGFVRATVGEVVGGCSCLRLPRGLCGYQDLYVLVKEEGVGPSSLKYSSGVEGYVDEFEPGPGPTLRCRGWAAGVHRDVRLERVEALVNGAVVAVADSIAARPDVAAHYSDDRLLRTGWELTLEVPRLFSFSQEVIMIVARTAADATILAMGSAHALMADAARLRVKHLSASLASTGAQSGESKRRPGVAGFLGRWWS